MCGDQRTNFSQFYPCGFWVANLVISLGWAGILPAEPFSRLSHISLFFCIPVCAVHDTHCLHMVGVGTCVYGGVSVLVVGSHPSSFCRLAHWGRISQSQSSLLVLRCPFTFSETAVMGGLLLCLVFTWVLGTWTLIVSAWGVRTLTTEQFPSPLILHF